MMKRIRMTRKLTSVLSAVFVVISLLAVGCSDETAESVIQPQTTATQQKESEDVTENIEEYFVESDLVDDTLVYTGPLFLNQEVIKSFADEVVSGIPLYENVNFIADYPTMTIDKEGCWYTITRENDNEQGYVLEMSDENGAVSIDSLTVCGEICEEYRIVGEEHAARLVSILAKTLDEHSDIALSTDTAHITVFSQDGWNVRYDGRNEHSKEYTLTMRVIPPGVIYDFYWTKVPTTALVFPEEVEIHHYDASGGIVETITVQKETDVSLRYCVSNDVGSDHKVVVLSDRQITELNNLYTSVSDFSNSKDTDYRTDVTIKANGQEYTFAAVYTTQPELEHFVNLLVTHYYGTRYNWELDR